MPSRVARASSGGFQRRSLRFSRRCWDRRCAGDKQHVGRPTRIAVEKLLFNPVTITGVEAVGESFRLLSMQGFGFQGVQWIPGQTVQIFLGNLIKRAHTPMSLDPYAGSASFLFYLHGKGPGSEWAASAKAANICQVMRPKNSIDFTNFT